MDADERLKQIRADQAIRKSDPDWPDRHSSTDAALDDLDHLLVVVAGWESQIIENPGPFTRIAFNCAMCQARVERPVAGRVSVRPLCDGCASDADRLIQ